MSNTCNFAPYYSTRGVTVESASKFGFVVIVPEFQPGDIRLTCQIIKSTFPEFPSRICLPVGVSDADYGFCSKLGLPIDRGSATVTSLINKGMSKSSADWNFILMPGAKPTQNLIKKFLYFCRDDRDVLYPVVRRKVAFYESAISGIFFNRTTNDELPEREPDLNMARLIWAAKAMSNGSSFKAIVGGAFN